MRQLNSSEIQSISGAGYYDAWGNYYYDDWDLLGFDYGWDYCYDFPFDPICNPYYVAPTYYSPAPTIAITPIPGLTLFI